MVSQVGAQDVKVEFRRPDVYQERPCNPQLWKGGDGSRSWQREKSNSYLLITTLTKGFRTRMASSEVAQVGPKWSRLSTPTLISHWMWAAQGKGMPLDGGSLQLRQSLKGLTAEGHLQTQLAAAGSTNASGKGILGRVSQCPPQWETPVPVPSP